MTVEKMRHEGYGLTQGRGGRRRTPNNNAPLHPWAVPPEPHRDISLLRPTEGRVAFAYDLGYFLQKV